MTNKLTKQDFEAVAQAVVGSTLMMDKKLLNKEALVESLIKFFNNTNTAFDEVRFYEACFKNEKKELLVCDHCKKKKQCERIVYNSFGNVVFICEDCKRRNS